MNFPQDIKNKIEVEAEKYKISDLILKSKNLTENYKKLDGTNKRLVTSKMDVILYGIVRMPATFGALAFSLTKMLENFNGNIDSILDVGSGTGNSIIVCNELFKDIKSFSCVEREPEMINFAKTFIEKAKDVSFYNQDSTLNMPQIKADLVIASYFLNELNEEKCFEMLNRLSEATNDCILIVEPGTPDSFNRMRKIRDYFVNKGFYIISPCPHMSKCPIAEGDWCHFVERIPRSKLHKLLKEADVPYENEKFTFLAVSKNPISNKTSRVLKHPLINAGFIKLELCKPDGIISEVTVTKKDKDKFKQARKINAGDTFNV